MIFMYLIVFQPGRKDNNIFRICLHTFFLVVVKPFVLRRVIEEQTLKNYNYEKVY